MADPITDEFLVAQPKRLSAKEKWATKGVTDNPATAKRKIAASRAARRKIVPKAPMSASYPKPLVQAVEAISEIHGVSRAWVLRRFIEDGIRKYGDSATRELAGLQGAPKVNVFDPLTPAVAGLPQGETIETFLPRPGAEYTGTFVPMGSNGPPLTFQADSITGEIEDEQPVGE